MAKLVLAISSKYFTSYLDAFTSHLVWKEGKPCLDFNKSPDLEAYYIKGILEVVSEMLSIEGLTLSQIKMVFPPQISSSFITNLSCRMNVARDKFIDIANDTDLFTSSLPYTLQYACEHNLVEVGDIGLIISVSSGIQVGCAIYYF